MLNERGFTLIEIIVVIGIVIVIFAFGATTDFSSFTSDTFYGERDKIVSLLEKARSRAMANMFESEYGVCYEEDEDSYVIFQGSTCGLSDADLISANVNIAENTDSIFPTIVFEQVTGNSSKDIIHITDGIKSADITINNEGAINW